MRSGTKQAPSNQDAGYVAKQSREIIESAHSTEPLPHSSCGIIREIKEKKKIGNLFSDCVHCRLCFAVLVMISDQPLFPSSWYVTNYFGNDLKDHPDSTVIRLLPFRERW